jgi:hypothetical protein
MDAVIRERALESVGEGWNPLINIVYDKKPAFINIVQVKEKFGTLRIYLDILSSEEYASQEFVAFREVIGWAERESSKTCEWCGKPGTSDNRYYWLLTLCTSCKRKRKRLKDKGA